MKWILGAAAALVLLPMEAGAGARPLLYDAVALNIGVNCQWQSYCMAKQRTAMKRSLAYVTKEHPPHWRVELCNRNASRGGYRVDWIGYDHCIRNSALKQPRRNSKRR